MDARLLSNVFAGLPSTNLHAASKRLEEARVTNGLTEGSFTPREQEVIRLLVEGHTNRQIGGALSISNETAKKHVQRIIAKLGVSDRTQAAVKAVRMGLVRDTC